jgi:hypothetical protein
MTCYFENTLAIEAKWLIDENIISDKTYKRYKSSGKIKQLQLGGNGRKALIEYASLPKEYQQKVEQKIGDPRQTNKYRHFRSFFNPDREAISFFANYKLQDGRLLPTETAKEYCTNVMFLNALNQCYNSTIAFRRSSGGNKHGVWLTLTEIVAELKDEYKHTLPGNELRLRYKFNQYKAEGYTSLIHRNFGNSNSRKVNESIERLILSIYIMNNKPYANMVQAMYLEFLAGKIDFVDITTGEVFNKFDFYNEKDQPITISEATVWNYINDPKNRAIVDSVRNDAHSFNNMHRPFLHRHKPEFSLSKISLDDRDLPRKMFDGKRVKAYYAYDVASEVLIGTAYSKSKDRDLFLECLRNMFRFLDRNSLGFPLEVEVEHHLVNSFKGDLMKAGVMFPFVRFCNPGNSQEKHAEHLIRSKKLSIEKRNHEGIGRFYSKLEANRPKLNKEWNEEGIQVIEKRYEYNQLVADDLKDIETYNNTLHGNQKKYPGMTRMDVLKLHMNNDAAPFNKAMVARHVGEMTETSILRNQYLFVKNGKYLLPSADILSLLKPNNYTVKAYYLPNENGTIPEVFIYQNDEYLAKCSSIETFNTSAAETTQKDRDNYTEQSKYVSHFDKMIKDGRLGKTTKLAIISTEQFTDVEPEIFTPSRKELIDLDKYQEEDSNYNWEERAINSM